MNNCPRCSSVSIVKAGRVFGKQRYKCKSCNYFFTVRTKGMPSETKRMAIHLYLEGLSVRHIARILDVSDVAVGKWLKPAKPLLSSYRKPMIIVKPLHKVEHFLISREIFRKYGWLLIGLEENDGICLLGSIESGNCEIKSPGNV